MQGIGLAALVLGISIYQTNKRKTMLLLGMTACLLWSVHFFLLGAVTGASMNLIDTGRSFAFYKNKPTKRNRWILWFFISLVTLATLLTWQGIISILPLSGSVIGSIAYWQKKPKYIRRLGFMTSPPWLVYNVISGSYPGIAVEILKMTSNLIGQYRFDFKRTSRRKLLQAAKSA